MDRRNFIKTLMASGILGASPLVSQAASELFASAKVQPVMIVGQSGLPHAAHLVARLESMFMAAGIQHVLAAASASQLSEYSHVSALLDRVPGTRVIGVMDDAAALIFQQLAAARGGACALSTHHRFTGQEVRHCCTSAGLEDDIIWSDPPPSHAERIGRLYVGSIGGRLPAADCGAQMATTDWPKAAGAPGSLVSFLMTV